MTNSIWCLLSTDMKCNIAFHVCSLSYNFDFSETVWLFRNIFLSPLPLSHFYPLPLSLSDSPHTPLIHMHSNPPPPIQSCLHMLMILLLKDNPSLRICSSSSSTQNNTPHSLINRSLIFYFYSHKCQIWSQILHQYKNTLIICVICVPGPCSLVTNYTQLNVIQVISFI